MCCFKTKREADERKRWISGELAARRVPDLRSLETAPRAVTVAEACERWRSSRIDVSESTRVLHRVALSRVLPLLGERRIDELTVDDVNAMTVALADAGKKRETIRKSVKYLAAVLEEEGIDPNPARSKRIRLPHAELVELEPPTSEHVEAVVRLLPCSYRLPLLWLDWSGARLGSIEAVRVDDYDEPRRRVRLRAATTKARAALWVELPDVLADALEATLPPREDRDPDAALSERRRRSLANLDRSSLPRGRRAGVQSARSSSPPDLVLAPAGALLG
jgi:integrase